jgi:tRNA nucleotidyltransferase (CCA-adding enzyme)
VRDKLLGRESYDIDFALSNMTGEDFATRINAYLQAQGHQVHGIGVIKRNPDQSKQLETATFKLNGISIDVNNLRSETYDDSRIPIMAMGTAQQDSERRDFTINAMYYNIHTGLVEDLVHGLPDLRAGLVRTPLPPMTTFSDDPLRILRAARFAGRFGYKVHEDIEKAALEPTIQDKLLRKVSRERYGQEVGKMLLCRRLLIFHCKC